MHFSWICHVFVYDAHYKQIFMVSYRRVAPPRVQTFVWCILKNEILTRLELNRRGLLSYSDDLFCILCRDPEEDVDYLFGKCSIVTTLWSRFTDLMGVSLMFNESCVGILENWSIVIPQAVCGRRKVPHHPGTGKYGGI